ncbi:glycoside hydrolase family 23 protein [Lentinula aciculospora]|uniref:Glycoside hydrolase family 23 protein n=1 Tax=Lentinula aciculospora TaxID=153920 RepID=A0A9W9AHY2_9AGAR|nr:glycoside hydrolase family 23 protein [Lentinula aciculospora]
MRTHSFAFTFFCAATTVVASSSHNFEARNVHARHLIHARQPPIEKRCKTRTESESTSSTFADDSVQSSSSTTHSVTPTSTSTSAQASASSSGSGLLSVVSTCGAIGATLDITSQSGPNGNIYWINCGLSDDGWNPVYVNISQIIVKDLNTALQDSSTPFSACSSYIDKFNQYGEELNVPPIFIASFAMQESSCNPATVGGGGEEGLMQLTPDKCTDAPNGDCQDVDYNIYTGAKYFSDLLDSNDGDLFLSVGSYNGWYKGMTYADATAAASSDCCRCQQNLDYLHQFFNGWIQNYDPYANDLGVYHNLDVCGSD